MQWKRDAEIVKALLAGEKIKAVARRFNITTHRVAEVKRRWPIFFWNTSMQLRWTRWFKKRK